MDEELSPDELEDMVLTWLSQQKANVLVEVCALIPLDCSEQMKGKKKVYLNIYWIICVAWKMLQMVMGVIPFIY